jgi:hypothetical protein
MLPPRCRGFRSRRSKGTARRRTNDLVIIVMAPCDCMLYLRLERYCQLPRGVRRGIDRRFQQRQAQGQSASGVSFTPLILADKVYHSCFREYSLLLPQGARRRPRRRRRRRQANPRRRKSSTRRHGPRSSSLTRSRRKRWPSSRHFCMRTASPPSDARPSWWTPSRASSRSSNSSSTLIAWHTSHEYQTTRF